jgi:hypothetical protein
MARQIDVDNLDADQVAYIRQRPWLIAEAQQLGVEDIEERLAEVEAQAAAEAQKAAESGEYDDLNIKALRELAVSRQLDKSGNKAELIQRLTEEDQRLEAQLKRAEAVSINENQGDSVLGDEHPVPGQ